MISQVLRKQFWEKVGLFVSPHVIKLNERIQISWEYISDEDVLAYAEMIHKKTQEYGLPLSYFALMTLISLWYFVDKKVDCVVYEVGLWWKLDTTNLWKQPLATFITSIWFDHSRLLGKRLSQIQRNKMWIMKAGVPCYTPVNNLLMHRGARCKKAKLTIIKQWVQTNMLWDHQSMNASLAYQALVDKGYDVKKVKQWLMDVSHPWRLQFITDTILIDWAHNKEWIVALGKYIASIRDQYDSLITIFWTSKYDDEFDKIVPYLIEGDENYCVAPSYFRERAVKPAEYLSKISFEMKEKSSIESVLKQGEGRWLVLVYGSLYLVSDVLSFTW